MGKGGRLYERENKENSHPAMHGKRINPMSGCFGIQKNHCRRCLNDYHHPCFAVYDRMGPPVTIFRQTAVTDGYFSCCCRFGKNPFRRFARCAAYQFSGYGLRSGFWSPGRLYDRGHGGTGFQFLSRAGSLDPMADAGLGIDGHECCRTDPYKKQMVSSDFGFMGRTVGIFVWLDPEYRLRNGLCHTSHDQGLPGQLCGKFCF